MTTLYECLNVILTYIEGHTHIKYEMGALDVKKTEKDGTLVFRAVTNPKYLFTRVTHTSLLFDSVKLVITGEVLPWDDSEFEFGKKENLPVSDTDRFVLKTENEDESEIRCQFIFKDWNRQGEHSFVRIFWFKGGYLHKVL